MPPRLRVTEHIRDQMDLAAMNATTALPPGAPSTSFGAKTNFNVFTYAFCVFGIFANLLALCILHRARSSTNKRHVFMLRCLFANDGISLASKLVRTSMEDIWPSTINNVWMCRSRVLFRFFAWGSGCAGVVMSIDRWLALTKPFYYQQHISLRLLKRMMVILWFEVLCMVCLPFIGFGVYWDEESSKCVRMRSATKHWDVRYNYLYFGHCIIVLFVIIYANLAIVKTLCKNDSFYNLLMKHNNQGSLTCNVATKEEKSFAWFLFLLSVVFVICCCPEMLGIVLSRFVKDSEKVRPFYSIADKLLSLQFALNPCLNVLYHWTLVKSFCVRRKNMRTGRTPTAAVQS